MPGFWRDVVDLSDAADTPARQTAAVQGWMVLSVLSVAAVLMWGFLAGWPEQVGPAMMLTTIPLSQAIAAAVHRRQSRSHRRRSRSHRRRRATGPDECPRDGHGPR